VMTTLSFMDVGAITTLAFQQFWCDDHPWRFMNSEVVMSPLYFMDSWGVMASLHFVNSDDVVISTLTYFIHNNIIYIIWCVYPCIFNTVYYWFIFILWSMFYNKIVLRVWVVNLMLSLSCQPHLFFCYSILGVISPFLLQIF
jgi:hypothetical protein